MIDPTLEAAFASTAQAKVPGRSYTPKLPLGTHTVILKQFNLKNTRAKGRMFNAEFVILESDKAENVKLQRSWAWFTGADPNGIQDGFLRAFLETAARSIGDRTSTIPQLGAMLAGQSQFGRGLLLKVIVQEQRDAKGNLKIDPKAEVPGTAYKEAIWYPIAQTLEQVVEGRKMLDSSPEYSIKEDGPVTVAQPIAAAVATQPVVQQAQQAPAPAVEQPASQLATAGNSMAEMLARLQKK